MPMSRFVSRRVIIATAAMSAGLFYARTRDRSVQRNQERMAMRLPPSSGTGVTSPSPMKSSLSPGFLSQLAGPSGIPTLFSQWAVGTRSDHEINYYFQQAAVSLALAWPKDWPAPDATDLPEFVALAQRYQQEKHQLFSCAESALNGQRAAKLEIAMECADLLHGKPGHQKNVVKLVTSFTDSPGFTALFGTGSKQTGFTTEPGNLKSAMIEAAKWHGLADRDIPVAVLAARRILSPQERIQYIKRRSEQSANIYQDYGFEHPGAAELIRNTRVFGTASAGRPPAAQLLDLFDRVAAMGSKPFFKKPDGSVDLDKLFNALNADLVLNEVFIDPTLQVAVKQFLDKSLPDRADLESRTEDIYLI